MLFEKKKLKIETLGEYLSEVRANLLLTMEEVAKKTSINLIFLDSLEKGNLAKLPADVYVYGFLKQLAALYRIEAGLLIDQYKKEKNIQKQIKKSEDFSITALQRFVKKVVITPKVVSISAISIFIILTLGYIVWQVFSINRTPNLEIFEPKDNQIVSNSFVAVRGRTDAGMSVLVNNKPVFVDNKGNFQDQLSITSGPSSIIVTAKNKFDKSIIKTVSIVGEASSTIPALKVELKLLFSEDVALSFTIDGGGVQQANFKAGDSKTLNANQKIILSTSNAGATKAFLNGQSLGALGRLGEPLQNIPFSLESAIINNNNSSK